MPLYDYHCEKGHRYEKREPFGSPATQPCERCGETARRVLHAPAIAFKGAGWYQNDSRGSRPSASKKEEKSSRAAKSEKSVKSEQSDGKSGSATGRKQSGKSGGTTDRKQSDGKSGGATGRKQSGKSEKAAAD